MRQRSIEFKSTQEERKKAKKSGAKAIKERALQDGASSKKIRHSFEERAFFFPLPCATITFPIKTNSKGWNQTPVMLNAMERGQINVQRCGDSRYICLDRQQLFTRGTLFHVVWYLCLLTNHILTKSAMNIPWPSH
jgi:hypothetical protein